MIVLDDCGIGKEPSVCYRRFVAGKSRRANKEPICVGTQASRISRSGTKWIVTLQVRRVPGKQPPILLGGACVDRHVWEFEARSERGS